MNTRTPTLHQGYVLLLALVISSILATVTFSVLGYISTSIVSERVAVASVQAQAIADAAFDKAVYELNQSANYIGETDTALGVGTFSVVVASVDSNTKQITITSSVPDTTNPVFTRVVKARVAIDTSIIAFRYGVQTGQGGVTMNNGSVIQGNIFSNGDISGSGTITGDATVAGGSDPTPNQSWTVQNSTYNVADVSAKANIAQSFKPSLASTLTRITLNLKKTGTPADLVLKVVTDNNGKPSKTVLASGTLSASLVTGTLGYAEVTLDVTPALTANTTYWIIAIAPVSATNYYSWGLDTAAGYTNGAPKYSANWNAASPSWSAITGDLDFNVYVSGTATSISGVSVGGNAWAASLISCAITGDAKYLTSSSCSVGGTTSSGVTPATPVPLAISDAQIAEWEDLASAGGTTAGPYTVEGIETIGPQKIDGDLTIGINATLILSGPVWVNGDVTFSNNAKLLVSSATGNSGAIILADATGNTAAKGEVTILNNSIINGNGSAGSYPMIVTTNTGSSAVDLANNADSVIIFAPYGTVQVSNNAGANQITGKQIALGNNAKITYVNGLQNTSFSNGPGGSWALISGTFTIVR